ncbi:hypothetical protein GZH46_02712, partial [Fragariocoptes setiger]
RATIMETDTSSMMDQMNSHLSHVASRYAHQPTVSTDFLLNLLRFAYSIDDPWRMVRCNTRDCKNNHHHHHHDCQRNANENDNESQNGNINANGNEYESGPECNQSVPGMKQSQSNNYSIIVRCYDNCMNWLWHDEFTQTRFGACTFSGRLRVFTLVRFLCEIILLIVMIVSNLVYSLERYQNHRTNQKQRQDLETPVQMHPLGLWSYYTLENLTAHISKSESDYDNANEWYESFKRYEIVMFFRDKLFSNCLLMFGGVSNFVILLYNYMHRYRLAQRVRYTLESLDCGYYHIVDDYLRTLCNTDLLPREKIRLLRHLAYFMHDHNVKTRHKHADVFGDRHLTLTWIRKMNSSYQRQQLNSCRARFAGLKLPITMLQPQRNSSHLLARLTTYCSSTISTDHCPPFNSSCQQGPNLEQLHRALLHDYTSEPRMVALHAQHLDRSRADAIQIKSYKSYRLTFRLAIIPMLLLAISCFLAPQVALAIEKNSATTWVFALLMYYNNVTLILVLVTNSMLYAAYSFFLWYRLSLFQRALSQLHAELSQLQANELLSCIYCCANCHGINLMSHHHSSVFHSIDANASKCEHTNVNEYAGSTGDIIVQMTHIYNNLVQPVQCFNALVGFTANIFCGWLVLAMIVALFHHMEFKNQQPMHEFFAFTFYGLIYIILLAQMTTYSLCNLKMDQVHSLWLSIASKVHWSIKSCIMNNTLEMYSPHCMFAMMLFGKRISLYLTMLTTLYIVSGLVLALMYGL